MQPAGWLSDHLRKRRVFVFGSCAAMGVGSVLMVSAARSRLLSARLLLASSRRARHAIQWSRHATRRR
jgi:hypothetical protein